MEDPHSLADYPDELKASYRPIRHLGAGGMGSVTLAEDLALHRLVAVKTIRTSDTELAERLLQEARALAAVEHPNVVRIYSMGTVSHGPYLVMENIEGAPLHRVERPLRVLDILLGVAEGLAAAHAVGIVHRDVKPGNILVTPDNRAVLVDFGLARIASRHTMTRTGAIVGTLGFLAPETIRGQRATAAADWFAWGVCLYLMLEGELPFTGEDMISMSRGDILPPRAARRIPPGGPLASLVERCLSSDPRRRVAGPQEIRQVLSGRGSPDGVPGPALDSSQATRVVDQSAATASGTGGADTVALSPPELPIASPPPGQGWQRARAGRRLLKLYLPMIAAWGVAGGLLLYLVRVPSAAPAPSATPVLIAGPAPWRDHMRTELTEIRRVIEGVMARFHERRARLTSSEDPLGVEDWTDRSLSERARIAGMMDERELRPLREQLDRYWRTWQSWLEVERDRDPELRAFDGRRAPEVTAMVVEEARALRDLVSPLQLLVGDLTGREQATLRESIAFASQKFGSRALVSEGTAAGNLAELASVLQESLDQADLGGLPRPHPVLVLLVRAVARGNLLLRPGRARDHDAGLVRLLDASVAWPTPGRHLVVDLALAGTVVIPRRRLQGPDARLRDAVRSAVLDPAGPGPRRPDLVQVMRLLAIELAGLPVASSGRGTGLNHASPTAATRGVEPTLDRIVDILDASDAEELPRPERSRLCSRLVAELKTQGGLRARVRAPELVDALAPHCLPGPGDGRGGLPAAPGEDSITSIRATVARHLDELDAQFEALRRKNAVLAIPRSTGKLADIRDEELGELVAWLRDLRSTVLAWLQRERRADASLSSLDTSPDPACVGILSSAARLARSFATEVAPSTTPVARTAAQAVFTGAPYGNLSGREHEFWLLAELSTLGVRTGAARKAPGLWPLTLTQGPRSPEDPPPGVLGLTSWWLSHSLASGEAIEGSVLQKLMALPQRSPFRRLPFDAMVSLVERRPDLARQQFGRESLPYLRSLPLAAEGAFQMKPNQLLAVFRIWFWSLAGRSDLSPKSMGYRPQAFATELARTDAWIDLLDQLPPIHMGDPQGPRVAAHCGDLKESLRWYTGAGQLPAVARLAAMLRRHCPG